MKQYIVSVWSIIRRGVVYANTYRKSHTIISTVIIIALIWGGYSLYHKLTGSTGSIQYITAKVQRGSIVSTVSGTGQVISNSQVDLKPKVNANVTAVYVKAGDRVKTGQVLFRLDATDAYKQVRDAKTALESANIALAKLKNPTVSDVLAVNDSIKQEEDNKKNQDLKVATAYSALLNANLQALPDVAYTTETAPTLSGSYLKQDQGEIKLSVFQGGSSGYSFSASGLVNCMGQININVAQPLCDTGLYIKWNSSNPQTNWVIDIPNTQSTSYLSNYTAWQTAATTRDIANAASDRNIASYKQKLADLTPGDDNLDVQSAKVTVEQRQNALLDAQTALSNYVITAPFDGVMAAVNVDIGASAVMASANTSAALGTIVTDKQLAQIALNESDIVKVKLGQKATMTFDAIDGLSVDGTVVEINTLGTITSGVVTYKVKVAFNTDDPRILPNMSVSADILTDSKDGVLYVPNQAIKHDANGYYVEEDSSSGLLFNSSSTRRFDNASGTPGYRTGTSTNFGTSSRRVRNGTGSSSNGYQRNNAGTTNVPAAGAVIVRVPVTIGIQNDTQTEITSGLHEGESVIVKKVTTTAGSAAAPSITSLFRPGGGNRPAGATGGAGGASVRAQ